jgi:acetyl-CoA carboxylase biotin carboxyl carrier protein
VADKRSTDNRAADPTTRRGAASAGGADERSTAERELDHAAIDRLAAELLPALIARVADSGLGEIEVREGSWRVRVRRPAGDGTAPARRTAERPSRAQPGHEGHGHQPAAFEGHRSAKEPRESRETRSGIAGQGNGSLPAGLVPVGPGGDRTTPERTDPAVSVDAGGERVVATSPAVGVYQPRPDARPGTQVRAGDRLGAVDMLGIPQEVVAPIDGIVGSSLVEPGQAVEYGQELVVIEPPDERGPAGGSGGPGASGGRATRPGREA